MRLSIKRINHFLGKELLSKLAPEVVHRPTPKFVEHTMEDLVTGTKTVFATHLGYSKINIMTAHRNIVSIGKALDIGVLQDSIECITFEHSKLLLPCCRTEVDTLLCFIIVHIMTQLEQVIVI